MPPTTQKSTGLKSAGKKPAAKKTRGPRVMPFDFDHGPDTDSSDDGGDARDEGGDSDTAVEPSDEEGDGSSSEEASAKVKTKFWCAYKGCRNPPMVKQSFRRHLEMHLANDNKMCTPKRLNRCGHGLRQSMKAERTMTKEQLVKDQAKMKKTQGEIRSHVRMDGVVAMVFSLTKYVEELSQKGKHIDVRVKFVKDYVNKGVIAVMYCESRMMRADLLTKAFPAPRLEELRGHASLK
ncbi:hypothetical protein PR003_g13908 [Phytophthora rubi]|uniref:Uncharacterized protein n=1 Tax=Phytophthora rubi TaxID=129364 RepID=A0A6A4F4D7_9STRA|nr:hypothetical protein PR003_g13908 [Phytophthora rubi]